MATSIFRAETKNLDELAKRFGKSRTAFTKVAREQLNSYGVNMVKNIQRDAPKKEGNFASGFAHKVEKRDGAMQLSVTWTPRQRPKDLIWWLLRGTGIYGDRNRVIRPKGKKPFPIPTEGGTIYRWSIRGMRGRDFITPVHEQMSTFRRSMAQKVGAMTMQMLLKRMGR